MTPIEIYIASPYSHKDCFVRQSRFEHVARYAAFLCRMNKIIYCPIVSGHPLVQWNVGPPLPGNWEFWKRIDLAFISVSKVMHILMLDGWEESQGVQEELKVFEDQKKPIIYIPWARDGNYDFMRSQLT